MYELRCGALGAVVLGGLGGWIFILLAARRPGWNPTPTSDSPWRSWQADSGSELRFLICEMGIDAPQGLWLEH